LAVSPPIVLDGGTYAPGIRGPLEHRLYITKAGRYALSRCGEVGEDRTVVISVEELSGEGE
jgi:hypothetical protein